MKALVSIVLAGVWIYAAAGVDIGLELVAVGNAGNLSDPTTGFGAVAFDFAIGKYEVTNTQYAEFLNAKAATDPFNLYSVEMGTNAQGGILRAGPNGSFSYPVKAGFTDKPVVFVSVLDALRFTNWLNNGRGTGDTETGAYTLSLGGLAPRNAGARVWLPSEDEWYKAAYYQPPEDGGDLDYYWLWPTRSNTAPTISAPNSSDPNSANWNGGVGGLTNVGSYTLARSFYGTFDQSGNVSELNDTVIGGSTRGRRGGSHDDAGAPATARNTWNVGPEDATVGFRVAVPEPNAGVIFALCAGAVSGRRSRR